MAKTELKLGMAAKKPRKSRKDRIIEVAEKLFAQRGFNGVSLREITREAGVDVALVKYYFDNKEGLFDALLQRRADILNRERGEALDRVLARNNPAPVEDIIDAFTHPLLNEVVGEDSTWRDYFGLLAQVNNNPEWGGQVMSKYFDPLVRRFIYALKDALPEADMVDIYWCYHFLSGALTLTFADTRRIDSLSGGLCHSADFESVHKRMVPFIAAGFRSICAERAAERAATPSTETSS